MKTLPFAVGRIIKIKTDGYKFRFSMESPFTDRKDVINLEAPEEELKTMKSLRVWDLIYTEFIPVSYDKDLKNIAYLKARNIQLIENGSSNNEVIMDDRITLTRVLTMLIENTVSLHKNAERKRDREVTMYTSEIISIMKNFILTSGLVNHQEYFNLLQLLRAIKLPKTDQGVEPLMPKPLW